MEISPHGHVICVMNRCYYCDSVRDDPNISTIDLSVATYFMYEMDICENCAEEEYHKNYIKPKSFPYGNIN